MGEIFSHIIDSFVNNLILEQRYRMILQGLQVTLLVTFCSAILGTLLGGLVCRARMSRRGWVQQAAKIYIDLMRGTPVLVLLMLMYYVFMAPMGATGIVVAIVTFAMNSSVYIGEMLRTGIEGIDKGQREAGLALGFTPAQVFMRIILPQVVRQIMPVYLGEVISLLKGTSIIGYIAVMDMTRASDLIRSRTFDAFFPLIITAAIYFLIAWLIGMLLNSLVQKRPARSIIAAVLLVALGTLGSVPSLPGQRKPVQSEQHASAPAVFQHLAGQKVGVIIGSIQDIAVTNMAPSANIHRYSTQTDLLAALDNGKVDVAGSETLTLDFNKQLAAMVDSVNAGLPPKPIAACFKMGNTELQEDFNRFLEQIRSDGTYNVIMDRWRKAYNPASMPVPKLRGKGRKLRVATFPSMPPFNFICQGELSGLEPDLLAEWANRRNWQIEYLIMDFASQIPAVQTGKADVAVGAISITDERSKQVLFSEGYLNSYIMLITRKGEGYRLGK